MQLKKYLSSLTDPSYLLYKLSKSYVRTYEGYSYRFVKNGEARLLKKLSGSNVKTIFDVGANIGDWSVLAASEFPGADIHAFELSKSTFSELNRVADQYGFHANDFGLSDDNAEITYKDYGDGSTVNTIVTSADFHDKNFAVKQKRARVMRGDDYCLENNIETIDLLKIDVEGAEHLVLQGFERMFTETRVSIVQFEYGFVNGDAHFLMRDFFNLFKSWGYVVGPLKPKGAIFKDFNYQLNNFKSGPNYIAVPQSRPDLIDLLAGPSIKGFF